VGFFGKIRVKISLYYERGNFIYKEVYTMKNFILGVLLTIVIEVIIFAWNTCNVQVTSTYSYNPQAIVNMLPEGKVTTVTK
jgi:hypothetical protein